MSLKKLKDGADNTAVGILGIYGVYIVFAIIVGVIFLIAIHVTAIESLMNENNSNAFMAVLAGVIDSLIIVFVCGYLDVNPIKIIGIFVFFIIGIVVIAMDLVAGLILVPIFGGLIWAVVNALK